MACSQTGLPASWPCGVWLVGIHEVLSKALSALFDLEKGRFFMRYRSQGKPCKCQQSTSSALCSSGAPDRRLIPQRAPVRGANHLLILASSSPSAGKGLWGCASASQTNALCMGQMGHPLGVPAVASRGVRSPVPSSWRPLALRQTTSFNLGEGNTSAFPLSAFVFSC